MIWKRPCRRSKLAQASRRYGIRRGALPLLKGQLRILIPRLRCEATFGWEDRSPFSRLRNAHLCVTYQGDDHFFMHCILIGIAGVPAAA